MPERPSLPNRVVVIGGGLTGLTTAYRIAQMARTSSRAPELLVLEAKDRVGGAIWTRRLDGFILEAGADSFITNKPWGVELCRELGLGEQLLGTDPRYRRSFVVREGRLVPVPEGFVLMTPSRLGPVLTSPLLSWRGKLRMLLDLVLPRGGSDDGDESLAAFVKRRFGREVLERLVQPLVGGIYTADPSELSLKATLPRFLEMEQAHRSLILASWRATPRADQEASGARYGLFATLAEGMDTLPRALAEALPAGSVRTGAAVRRISRTDPAAPWRVELLDGPPIEAAAVVLATEAHAAARLIDGFDPELALHLRAIPYASSAILNIAYARDQVAHPLDGFGVVVPAIEGRSILAVSFTSIKFSSRAPEGTVLMRVFFGGAMQPELYERDDDALRALAQRELGELLGASGQPILAEVARHPRAMPQYTLGHRDRVAAIRQRAARHPRLIVTGNAFDGVGIPDCIHAGQDAAEAVWNALGNAAATAAA